MPFGLCNAPATFERMMDRLLHGLKWTTCLCYLDDVVIFSPSFETHLDRLDEVLKVFRHAGLQLNSAKCQFGSRQLKILGHIVNKNGIQPDPAKINAIADFPPPADLKSLRSFLGLCSYFRRFIAAFATIARPLSNLLKNDTPFLWGTEQQAAFTRLKTALTSTPILGHFDDSAPTELRTDASGYGIGAVLIQHSLEEDHVIAYASRLLSSAERNYSITERECLAVVWSITKFRPYLYGRTFTVVTDHHALCWLSSLRDPIGRLGRWALRLQEYTFSVLHKSGKLHTDADCLSRHPVDPVDPENTEDSCFDQVDYPVMPISDLLEIEEEQRQDPALRAIIDRLSQGNPDASTRPFVLRNNVLYRHNFSSSGSEWLLVVPQGLRDPVLHELHASPTSGHLGVLRTYARIKERFYWAGMYKSVYKYVTACDQCQRHKTTNLRPAGLLHPLEPPSTPFFRVGVDLLGSFPPLSADNRWIVVAIDHQTRYAETKAVPTATATDVAQFLLDQIILKHGAPRELLTDRGRAFVSRVISEILRSCSIIHKPTTAYHPQANGLTERLNRTLANMLAMYVSSDHSNWDAALPFITFAYNSSRQDTTGFSPFFLLYGREPALLIDSLLPFPPDSTLTTFASEANSCSLDPECYCASFASRTIYGFALSNTDPASLVKLEIAFVMNDQIGMSA